MSKTRSTGKRTKRGKAEPVTKWQAVIEKTKLENEAFEKRAAQEQLLLQKMLDELAGESARDYTTGSAVIIKHINTRRRQTGSKFIYQETRVEYPLCEYPPQQRRHLPTGDHYIQSESSLQW